MFQRVIPVGLLGVNAVILGDEPTHQAVLVDPGGDATKLCREIADAGFKLTHILHTHGHIDHVGGTAECARASGAATYLHAEDQFLYDGMAMQASMLGIRPPATVPITHVLHDNDVVSCGELHFQVLHTPGHSPGSVSFYLATQKLVITGDALFAGGIGRTDLWGGDYDTLEKAILTRLYTLPEDTAVIPGHGPKTLIGDEKHGNPFVRV